MLASTAPVSYACVHRSPSHVACTVSYAYIQLLYYVGGPRLVLPSRIAVSASRHQTSDAGPSLTTVRLCRVLCDFGQTHSDFTKLIEHHKTKTGLPVIVDYYSDGCGPCRQIAPIYKKMAKQYKGKAVFTKVGRLCFSPCRPTLLHQKILEGGGFCHVTHPHVHTSTSTRPHVHTSTRPHARNTVGR